MDQCSFPTCRRIAEKNGYCISHAMYSNTPDVKEKPKPIAQKSDKLKKQEREYKKIVKEMLDQDNRCELATPVCTKIAQGLHHMKRRGINLLNRKYLKRACNACNGYVEQYPAWSLKNGLLVSVHKKETHQ